VKISLLCVKDWDRWKFDIWVVSKCSNFCSLKAGRVDWNVQNAAPRNEFEYKAKILFLIIHNAFQMEKKLKIDFSLLSEPEINLFKAFARVPRNLSDSWSFALLICKTPIRVGELVFSRSRFCNTKPSAFYTDSCDYDQ
jgi:hypothetical protein